MRYIFAMTAALAFAPVLATAQSDSGETVREVIVTDASQKSVAATTEALVGAVEAAGATVFAVVDHGQGARDVDMEIGESQLVIFGNPQLGTPAMADDMQAGLFLPLRMLVYENAAGQVTVAYEDPGMVLTRLNDIPQDADYIGKMQSALQNFMAKAVE